MDGGRGHISVDALDEEGHYVNKLLLNSKIAPPYNGGVKSLVSADLPLRQTGPGRYEGWFDAPQIGTYLVNVVEKKSKGPDAATVIGLSTPYSPEYRNTTSNRYLMTQLAQSGMGRTDPAPSEIFGGDRPSVFTANDMVPSLMLLSMLLLPFDIAIRRLAIDPNDLHRLWYWLTGKSGKKRKGRAVSPELSRLKEVKQGVADRQAALQNAANGNGGASGNVNATPNLQRPSSASVLSHSENSPIPNVAPRTATLGSVESPVMSTAASATRTPPTPPIASAEAEEEPEEEAGMSRLMAAKLRARQREQDQKDGK